MIITCPANTIPQMYDTVRDWTTLRKSHILATNKTSELPSTEAEMGRVKVLIISHCTLSKLPKYLDTGEDKSRHARASLVFHRRWSLAVCDEAHAAKNKETDLCKALVRLSEVSEKRVAMTGTMICNNPGDAVGLCMAVGADSWLCKHETWMPDANQYRINPRAVQAFLRNADRKEKYGLPPITHRVVPFDAELSQQDASFYNQILGHARTMACVDYTQTSHDDRKKVGAEIVKLQQCLVAPMLARLGATKFKQSPSLFLEAAKQGSGALHAMLKALQGLFADGHTRVIVCAQHTKLLSIAREYLALHARNLAAVYQYNGDMSTTLRTKEKSNFLNHGLITDDSTQTAPKTPNAILLLSVKAGGTGLNICKGKTSVRKEGEDIYETIDVYVTAMVMCLSRPFSPATLDQAAARVHRIGQKEACEIVHLMAPGSVDWAINNVHTDKSRLANAVMSNDWTSFEGGADSWKRGGSIVSSCFSLDIATGNFPAVGMKLPTRTPTSSPYKQVSSRGKGKRRQMEAHARPGLAVDTTIKKRALPSIMTQR